MFVALSAADMFDALFVLGFVVVSATGALPYKKIIRHINDR